MWRPMGSVTAAGASDRYWLLTHRILTGHTLQVRDCSDEGCAAVIPIVNDGGGGTIQGISISGPLFGPSTTACLQ